MCIHLYGSDCECEMSMYSRIIILNNENNYSIGESIKYA